MAKLDDKFTLFLAGWQIRMAKDFLGKRAKFSRVTIKPGVIQCPASYKIPVEGIRRDDWVLYLTDEQMAIVKEKFGIKTAVPVININSDLIKKGSVIFS